MPHDIFCKIKAKKQGQISDKCSSQQSIGQHARKDHENFITVFSFGSGTVVPRDMTSGMATAKRYHLPVVFTKLIDRSSPQLAQALAQNEILEKVEFSFFRNAPDGMPKPQEFYKITYESCTLVEIRDYTPLTINPANNFFGNMQDISFTFNTVKWEHLGSNTSGDDKYS